MKKAVYIVLFLFAFAKGFSQQDSIGAVPEFPGGVDNLAAFIKTNVDHSKLEKVGVRGKVYVHFLVTETGNIDSIGVLKSSGSTLLDDEVVRIVSIMPNWKPGKKDGKNISVRFNLPFNYQGYSKEDKFLYQPPEGYYFNEGVKESTAGNFHKALENFNQCLVYNNKDIDALYNKGAIYLKLKEIDSACEEWNKIKGLGKNDADALIKQYCSNSDTSLALKPVEKMPEYPGGMQKLINFIQYNIKDPKGVKKSDLTCNKVFLKFLIHEDGKISDIMIVKGTGSSVLDEEAKRLVSIMPNWIPAQQNGKVVPVYFNLPIKFSNYNVEC